MKRCFVIANGESRKEFDINKLWPYGTIIGINAVYRDKPKLDYLVGVDIKMMNEIGDSGYTDAEIWTYPRSQIKYDHFKRFKEDKGWSSGPTAVLLAIQKEFDEIFIVGMDFSGVLREGKSKLRHNNMYKGTPNYREASREATFSGNWENQMKRNCQSSPKTKFIRVCQKDVEQFRVVPKKLRDVENLSQIFYEDLEVLMGAWTKIR